MKFRSFISLLVVVVIALSLVAIAGLFWLTSNSPFTVLQGGERSSPAAAIFVPKQAPAMVSLLVNPDRLENFRVAIAPPGQRRKARAELRQFRENLLAQTGLNYRQDVLPWLGDEVTLAVTTPDVDRDGENGQQPGYLLAIATKDAQRAREFLQLFWQKRAIAGIDLNFEQFAGVKIIYGNRVVVDDKNQAASSELASAVVGDRFVLFANHPKVLREAINTVQASDLGLENSRTYQDALRQLSSRKIGLAYVNLSTLGRLNQSDAGTGDRRYDSLLMGLELNPQGLLADTALLPTTGTKLPTQKPALAAPVKALKYVPSDSPIAAAGTDLNHLWTALSSNTDAPLFNTVVNESSNALQQRWGVASIADLVNWVTGEYALGMVPNGQTTDWIFAAKRSPETQAAIERLDAIANEQGLSVGQLMLDEQPVSAWTKLSTVGRRGRSVEAQVQGVRTTVGEYELFATSVEALDRALKTTDQSLLKADDFEQAIDPLESKNDGYLYLDWATAQGLIEKQFPVVRLVDLAGKPLLDHVRSVSVSSYGNEENVTRGGVFIRLKD